MRIKEAIGNDAVKRITKQAKRVLKSSLLEALRIKRTFFTGPSKAGSLQCVYGR